MHKVLKATVGIKEQWHKCEVLAFPEGICSNKDQILELRGISGSENGFKWHQEPFQSSEIFAT